MRVVAVLVGIRHRERERAERFAPAGVSDHELLWLPRAPRGDAGGEVAEKAAPRELVEALRDLGLEADAGRSEERMAVGQSRVDEPGTAV